jgi:precorrin-2 C20-methyltransferase / precorrin-3B C17-methyltransferase
MKQETCKGRLFGVGVGPGDPELLTLKALRIVRAAHVVTYPAARHGHSNARAVVAAKLRTEQLELPLIYPITTETSERDDSYEEALRAFYDEAAENIAAHLEQGRDVAALCEGDPFFYGSFMYLHDRLAHRYITEVVPGVTSISAACARLGTPPARRDTPLTILPGTLSEEALTAKLSDGGAYAIVKLGRNFTKVHAVLRRTGLIERAHYIERATMHAERILPLEHILPEEVPYFSTIVVPATNLRLPTTKSAKGSVRIVGLGPGTPAWISPEASRMLREASDLVGYQPYLDRIPFQPRQRRHGSDNRVEIERARHALTLAEEGHRVCVVSSGDPGIFAMATAVMEALEQGTPAWRDLDIRVIPGISAMQAAAARAGAPLGHDFCVISLSDNLKNWDTIAQRLDAAARADFAIALYNPASSQRQEQLEQTRVILARRRAPETPVVLATDVGGAHEQVTITDLARFDARAADMRTVILVGSSRTRTFQGKDGQYFVYTPRTYRPA